MANKYGLRPPVSKPSIPFAVVIDRAAVLPPHPPIDLLTSSLASGWRIGYNDVAGTCAAINQANSVRILTTLYGSPYLYPDDNAVAALYRTQNPGWDPRNPSYNDYGMDLQTLYEWWTKNTWGGRKLLGFAQVDHKKIDDIRVAMSMFRTVDLGIMVQPHNQDEFELGKSWTYDPNEAYDGGHAVASGGHWDQVLKDFVFLTWSEKATLTQLYESRSITQVWVKIYQEHIDHIPDGFDLDEFKSIYTLLTNREFPGVPTPTPKPNVFAGCLALAKYLKLAKSDPDIAQYKVIVNSLNAAIKILNKAK